MKDKTTILLTIAMLTLLVCNIALYANKILSPSIHNKSIEQQYQDYLNQRIEQEQEQEDIVVSDEEMAEEQLKDLKSMGEQDRMYTYVHTFLSYIESSDYKSAYDLLYSDFKEQYFKTQNEFEEYVKKKYPQFMKLEYESIERQGEYYIVSVLISSEIASDNPTIQQRFVLHENDFNDFEISFQV